MRRNLKYLSKITAICIIIYTIFSSINIIKGESSLSASGLVIDDWIIDSITEGSYDDYVLLWDSLGVVPSDYLTLETHPTDIKFLIYQHTTSDATIYLEIYIYDSITEAESEFNNQKWHSRPPIFERFLYGERIFVEGPYLFFMFSNEVAEQILIPYNKYGQTYISLVDDFFIKLFQKISPILYGYDVNPPDVIFSGKVIWGVRPGDKFTWNSSHNTFTGSLQTGMSHKSGSSVTTWEIIEISDDYLAILIGEHRDNFKIFNEYFSSIILDTEYTIHTWHTVDEGPFNLVTSSLSQATIYPLYMNGKTIRDFIEDEIEHLPEKNYMEGDLSAVMEERLQSLDTHL